jgi:hypothetical protein
LSSFKLAVKLSMKFATIVVLFFSTSSATIASRWNDERVIKSLNDIVNPGINSLVSTLDDELQVLEKRSIKVSLSQVNC